MTATQDPRWMEFHVEEDRGYHVFRFGQERPQACMLALDFWREEREDKVELVRDGTVFDRGTVTTTDRTRHFTGLAKVVPEAGKRWPADMSHGHLIRLCADWLLPSDMIRVRYPSKLFYTRRRNLEILGSVLK